MTAVGVEHCRTRSRQR